MAVLQFCHGLGIEVAGEADKAGDFFVFGFFENFEHTVFGADGVHVFKGTDEMDLKEVEAVGLKAVEAFFEMAHAAVIGSLTDLCGEENFVSAIF
jgi:hypothetical protein